MPWERSSLPAREVAEKLGFSPNAVNLAKHDVLKRIRELILKTEEIRRQAPPNQSCTRHGKRRRPPERPGINCANTLQASRLEGGTRLGRISGWLNQQGSDHGVELIQGAEVLASVDGLLVVRLLAGTLEADVLQKVVQQLEDASPRLFTRMYFDFSQVVELAGPWGVHFAILIHLARQVESRVSLGELHGQPEALAWLFRHSAELRALPLAGSGGNQRVGWRVETKKVAQAAAPEYGWNHGTLAR